MTKTNWATLVANGRRQFDKHPLFFVVVCGVVLRLIAAFSGHGWFSVDDYDQGIAQAAHWLRNTTDGPLLAPFRSPLMPRILWLFMHLAQGLSVTDKQTLLHVVYACLGLFSALAIPATYLLSRRHAAHQDALYAAWLTAAYALIPRISTRALIEVIAITPLLWSMVWLEYSRCQTTKTWRFGYAVLAFLALGFAVLLRFQIGILWLPAAFWLLRYGPHRLWALAGLFVAGGFCALLQASIDYSMGRVPLSTPMNYLLFNLKFAHTYGTSAWYTYILHFLLYTVPPATLAFVKPLYRAVGQHALVSSWFLWFVGVHSLIGHKEDRFMFSVLPLFFILLGTALAAALRGSIWQKRSVQFFWATNACALLFVVFSDAHQNLTNPLLHVSRHTSPVQMAVLGFDRIPDYYLLDSPTKVHYFNNLQDLGQALQQQSMSPDYVWFREVPSSQTLADLREMTQNRCSIATTYEGDWVDKLLIFANRHNARRAPTLLVDCLSQPTPEIHAAQGAL